MLFGYDIKPLYPATLFRIGSTSGIADHIADVEPSTGYWGTGPESSNLRFLNGCVVLIAEVEQPTERLCPLPMMPTQPNGGVNGG
jgi:hypothetical protein